MEFQRDGWVVRWAYLLSEDYPPAQTTLCELFWRCVLGTPMKGLAVLFLLSAVCIGPTFLLSFLASFAVGSEVALLLMCPIGLLLTVNLFSDDAREQISDEFAWVGRPPDVGIVRNVAEVGAVIGGGMRSVKSRFCPIVRIVRSDE